MLWFENQDNYQILIWIDATAPTVTLDRAQPLTNISAHSYVLNATATDSGIGVNVTVFEYRKNSAQSFTQACIDEDGAPYSCTWDTSSLDDGKFYEVRVKANDSLGSFGDYDTHTDITLDKTSPNVTLLSPINHSIDLDGDNIIFRFNVTDITSKISNCSLLINHKRNQTNYTVLLNTTNNFTVNDFSENEYNWSVNCTDTAGVSNSSEYHNLTVLFDRESPIITLISPQNNSVSTTQNVNFNYNVTDRYHEIANCSLIVNNTLNQTDNSIVRNATQIFTISGVNDGDYNWSINCTDNSTGFFNIGSSGLFNVTVAKTSNLIALAELSSLFYERKSIRIIGEG